MKQKTWIILLAILAAVLIAAAVWLWSGLLSGQKPPADGAEQPPAQTQDTTDAPTQDTTDAPTQDTTDAPTQETTDAPTQDTTDAPTQDTTDAPTQDTTDAPTQDTTDAPTQEATDAPTQEATQAPAAPTAPDFTVYTADGQEVKLSDFVGKPVVLNFWATWCGPCRGEMPAFEAVYEAMGEQVQFLMVNLTDGTSDTVESASAFVADAGYTFPVFYDTTYSGAIAYNVTAIPATYLIDAQGNLVESHVGAMNQEVLENYLQQLLP